MINFKYLKLLNKQESLSLYIHIPFCLTKCYYCAFYSEDKSCWNEEGVSSYLDKLNKELLILKDNYNKPFETVFIGGGNPGVLTVNQLRTLLINIGPSRETTFEINPESLSEEHLSLFKEGLATRVSIGIQSFNDNILKILGRGARSKDNYNALSFCNKLDLIKPDIKDNYFVKNNIINETYFETQNFEIKYSFDLMSALPTQKLQDSIDDINILINNTNLKHLSLYCLTVEEGTYLYSLVKDNKIKKNSDLFEKNLLENLWAHLNKIGFEHYEVSNFAKDNNRCLHNLRYWNLSPYISLGSSSASTIYDNEKLIRLTNTSNKDSYVTSPNFSNYEEEILTKNQFLDEYLIVTLRGKSGLSFSFLQKHFNISKEVVLNAFSHLNSDNFIVDDDRVYLSESGFLLLDTIILNISIELGRFIS